MRYNFIFTLMRISNETTQQFSEKKNLRKLQKNQFNEGKVKIMNHQKLSNAKKVTKNMMNSMNDKSQSTIVFAGEMSITDQLIKLIAENNERAPKGRRYKNLQNYFTLLSFMGRHYYEILHSTLLFPTYRTAQTYRKQFIEKIGADDNMFNGDQKNIELILKNCLPEKFDSKAIIALDAAFVTPYVSVNPDGNIEGLIMSQNVGEKMAKKMILCEEQFASFISSNQKNIISAEFVFMFIPIDSSHRAFPICSIPASHGTATDIIIAKIRKYLNILQSKDIQVIGLATDGDRQYNSFSLEFMNYIIDDISEHSQKYVTKIMNDYPHISHFSDPFHLVKRDRYRKISKKFFVADPWNKAQMYSVHDLIALKIPEYVLSKEQARKMEDCLPLKLFSVETLISIIEIDDPGLFFSMLPSTLLLESIHSESLSRKLRIDYLMIGASLMILYELYKKTIKKSNGNYCHIEVDNIPEIQQCFTTEWSSQYISLAFSIVFLLHSEKTLNLGACGTHILEHYFGSIRRHAGGDNSHNRFIKAMKKVFIEQSLLNELDIPRQNAGRRSDSGFNETSDLINEENDLMYYLKIARGLLQNFCNIPEDTPIYDFALPHEIIPIKMFIESYLQIEKKKSQFSSTITTCITATKGIANKRYWIATNQIKNLSI